MSDEFKPPMGCLDAVDVGNRKMTIQTEFLEKPNWRVETKIYLGGALKKIYGEDLSAQPPELLQQLVNDFHKARSSELMASLKNLRS